jgi:hypothetical protein
MEQDPDTLFVCKIWGFHRAEGCYAVLWFLEPRRWWQYFPPKLQYLYANLHHNVYTEDHYVTLTTAQDSNLESCEECRKSEPLAARQLHEPATTTWAKTFSTYFTVAVQTPCHCLHQAQYYYTRCQFYFWNNAFHFRDTNTIALVQFTWALRKYASGQYVLNWCYTQ